MLLFWRQHSLINYISVGSQAVLCKHCLQIFWEEFQFILRRRGEEGRGAWQLSPSPALPGYYSGVVVRFYRGDQPGPAWNYIFKIVKTRLKDLGINFISIGLEIAGICFQDICSIFVELCLQDAQIALLHFTRLCCSNNGVNSITPSPALLLHHPWLECENIHPSLSSPSTWENLWSEVTTTAALEIGNLNTSPGSSLIQYTYTYSFYQYKGEERISGLSGLSGLGGGFGGLNPLFRSGRNLSELYREGREGDNPLNLNENQPENKNIWTPL